MPNDTAAVALTDSWTDYRVRPRNIESLTGLDFLADLPRSLQDTLETEVDAQ